MKETIETKLENIMQNLIQKKHDKDDEETHHLRIIQNEKQNKNKNISDDDDDDDDDNDEDDDDEQKEDILSFY